MNARIFAGLGSNVGDRIAFLSAAVAALGAYEGLDVVRTSPVYETTAVGPAQPDFLNAVAELDSVLLPQALLQVFKQVERDVGRSPSDPWGPREIDIDLLLYGSERIDEPDLRVPHLQLVKRAFVLVPLADIAPDVEVPGVGTVAALRERTDDAGVRRTDHLLL